MPPFSYQTFQSPYANTIAQLLAHQGDPQAIAAQQVAAANARAGEISANAWGGAVQNIAQAGSHVADTIARQQEIAPKLALEKIALDKAQQQQRGEQALSNALADHTLAPGAAGPQMPSFMTADHRYDIPALTDWLNGAGYGAQAPDLVGHAEKMNESLDKAQTAKVEAAQKQAIYIGNVAQGALKVADQIKMPLPGAVAFMAKPGIDSGQFSQAQLDTVMTRLNGLPPDQQTAYLQSFVAAADRVQKPITVKPDETLIGATGLTPLYTAEPKKDLNWLMNDAGTLGKPNQTPTAQQSFDAIRTRYPTPKGPVTTPEELKLDAFAKAIGRTGRADLTDDELQRYAQRQAQLAGTQQLQTHAAERTYDQAHPPPVDQTKLENNYRTVLLRAVSSRSGTLGREDGRVADANHALASFDQYLDPATGQYNIPAVPLKELALTTARLMAGGGNVGVEAMKNFEAATLKGDIAQAVTYITGQPKPATTQGIATMLRDIVQRQGTQAVTNRDQSLDYLHMIAPTELDPSRVEQLDRAQLTHLHASRLIQMPNGQKLLQTSDDGGRTWK